MRELEDLVSDLKQYLNVKRKELESSPNFNTYINDSLTNIERNSIENFEIMCKQVDPNSLYNAEIIKHFQEGADSIKREIDNITC